MGVVRVDEVGMLNINQLTAGSRIERGYFQEEGHHYSPSVPLITSMLREREQYRRGKKRWGETRERSPGKIRTEMPFAKESITTPRTQKSQRDF